MEPVARVQSRQQLRADSEPGGEMELEYLPEKNGKRKKKKKIAERAGKDAGRVHRAALLIYYFTSTGCSYTCLLRECQSGSSGAFERCFDTPLVGRKENRYRKAVPEFTSPKGFKI